MDAVMWNMVERAGWTFAQAFLSVFVLSDLATAQSAMLAGAAAVLSMVKTMVRDHSGA